MLHSQDVAFAAAAAAAANDDNDAIADVLHLVQVVSLDNLEDQELEKREITEGWCLLHPLSLPVDNYPCWQ